MARIEEKVKDIIDVRPHATSANFEGDSVKAVAAYHFTDITADLMAKWLIRVAEVSNNAGAANALAGFRGVGKSHFIAAFGGLLKQPELRTRIEDSHVKGALAQLQRKAVPVAFVRRGSRPTLIEEVKDALAETFPNGFNAADDCIKSLIEAGVKSAGDATLVLLVDSAFERTVRVSRDDGAVLADIAEMAAGGRLFVGAALDDDIEGADGANSAISRTFKIDYLDQEHLYKIVDTHIFPKHPRMLPILRGIFEQYRAVVPGFRWSATRFTSLYPLHPSIMELAPFVRLYLPDFALLGFASDAGARIMGRPADSLIAPDEVFDNVEKNLREVHALADTFAAFDQINDTVVAKTPVMKRMQAKLILKGLFLFSLNDEGVTAAEIGASMLIYDEKDPHAAVMEIDAVLKSFAEALPGSVRTNEDLDGKVRYALQLSGQTDLKKAMAAAATNVSAENVDEALRLLLNERFADGVFETEGGSGEWAACTADWRGSKRRGCVTWNPAADAKPRANGAAGEWEIRVVLNDRGTEDDRGNVSELPAVIWRPAPLTEAEGVLVSGLWILHNDTAIRSEFKDNLAAAIQNQTAAAEKVFQRAFLDEGTFTVDGFDYNLTEEARGADTLSRLASIMLDSLFGARYPMHPLLERPLEMTAVSRLTSDFFSGARPTTEEAQKNARDLAIPLGLAVDREGAIVPLSAEELATSDIATLVLDALKSPGGAAALDAVFTRLAAAPFGLTKESSYLVLGALAGQQLIDFVTAGGDRINRRSLDLNLVWDDLVAVATPELATYSGDRLVAWARLFTGDSKLVSLADTGALSDALASWLAEWKRRDIANKFDNLSDTEITSRIWRLAQISIRPFTSAAKSVSEMLTGALAVDVCLKSIADQFGDSEIEFERRSNELATVESFVAGAEVRREASRYAALCEFADNEEVDVLHEQLLVTLEDAYSYSPTTTNDELATLWENFKRSYSDLYVLRHGRTAAESRERLAEILDTDLWWEFDALSSIDTFDKSFSQQARRIVNAISSPDCGAEVEALLRVVPTCTCGFGFAGSGRRDNLPEELMNVVEQGLASYRDSLMARVGEIESYASEADGTASGKAARGLMEALLINSDARLSEDQIAVVRRMFGSATLDEPVSKEKARPAEPDIPSAGRAHVPAPQLDEVFTA